MAYIIKKRLEKCSRLCTHIMPELRTVKDDEETKRINDAWVNGYGNTG